jgi:hypothetical protein
MGKTAAGLLMTGLLAGLLAVGACSDSTSPEGSGYLTGTVTDAAGQPVPETAVLISFRPTFEDVLQPGAKAAFDFPPPDTLTSLRITDPCGEVIRTLCEGEGCLEPGMLLWDGLDDDGLRALEGIYNYVLSRPDTTITQNFVMIHFYDTWDPAAGRAHAWTGQQGRFRVDDACLGFGEVLEITDEQGEIIDERPLGRTVNLKFVAPDGRMALRDSVEFPASGPLSVNITLPD